MAETEARRRLIVARAFQGYKPGDVIPFDHPLYKNNAAELIYQGAAEWEKTDAEKQGAGNLAYLIPTNDSTRLIAPEPEASK